MVILWSGNVNRGDNDTSRNRRIGRDLANDIKCCSLAILRRRELIDGLPTLAPLSVAATPLFELALEVACQVTHDRLPYITNSTRGSKVCANERWFEAIYSLSHVCLDLPERRSADFLDFWFSQEDAGRSTAGPSDEPDVLKGPNGADEDRSPSQRLSDCLLGEDLDTSFDAEIQFAEEELDEPADVGGDMNITPDFVHTTNRVFDDTETLAARLAAQLQAAGRELVDLLGQVERCAVPCFGPEQS